MTGFTEPGREQRDASDMLSIDKTIAGTPVAPVDVATVDPVALQKSISSATEALLGYRQSDGHWVFELEADSKTTIDALIAHFTGTKVDRIQIAPGDVGATKIGHFGFFRPEHRDTLWRDAARWLAMDDGSLAHRSAKAEL